MYTNIAYSFKKAPTRLARGGDVLCTNLAVRPKRRDRGVVGSLMNPEAFVYDRLSSPLAVVVREAEAVKYGVYSDEDIRQISVVHVTSAEQRDALNRPLPGGLYDPKMGPTDHYSSCPTCGLDYSLCPGHLGHLELSLPVYLPALFLTLKDLLRGTCFHCHAFRVDRGKLWPLVDAIALMNAGMLVDAAKLLDASGSSEVSGGLAGGEEEDIEDNEERRARRLAARASGAAQNALSTDGHAALDRVRRKDLPPPPRSPSSRSPHIITLRKQTISSFFKAIAGAKKCSHCGKHSPTLKQENGCKLFCIRLPRKLQEANMNAGGVMGASGNSDDAMDDDDGDGDGADSGDGDSGVDVRRDARSGDRSRSERAPTVDEEDSESDDGSTGGIGQRKGGPVGGTSAIAPPAVSKDSNEAKLIFISPSEAQRHAVELWRVEGDLLSRVFADLSAGHFFQRVIPVPPNRFRPPSTVGDGVFEHSSNVLLGRVLAHDMELRRLLTAEPSTTTTGSSSAPAGGSALPAAISTERVLRSWEEMCRTVAAITDSTKTVRSSPTSATSGIGWECRRAHRCSSPSPSRAATSAPLPHNPTTVVACPHRPRPEATASQRV